MVSDIFKLTVFVSQRSMIRPLYYDGDGKVGLRAIRPKTKRTTMEFYDESTGIAYLQSPND